MKLKNLNGFFFQKTINFVSEIHIQIPNHKFICFFVIIKGYCYCFVGTEDDHS